MAKKSPNKIRKISATKARNNFFGIVQDAYLANNTYLIEKSGIPMAYIIPIKNEVIVDEEISQYSQNTKLEKQLTIKQKEQFEVLNELKKLRDSQPISNDTLKIIRGNRKVRL